MNPLKNGNADRVRGVCAFTLIEVLVVKDGWVQKQPVKNAASTLLVADEVDQDADKKWTHVAWDTNTSTNHMRGLLPRGGNELFTDGHTSWVRFSQMKRQSAMGWDWYW